MLGRVEMRKILVVEDKVRYLVSAFKKVVCGMKSSTRKIEGKTVCLPLNALRNLEEGDISGGFREGTVTEVSN